MKRTLTKGEATRKPSAPCCSAKSRLMCGGWRRTFQKMARRRRELPSFRGHRQIGRIENISVERFVNALERLNSQIGVFFKGKTLRRHLALSVR